MKIFTQLLSFAIICLLVSGQYGYVVIADFWYTIYATLTGIGVILSAVIGIIIHVALRDPSIVSDMEPKMKTSIIKHSYSPLAYLAVPLSWIILSNAGFIVLATLSVLSTTILISAISSLKSKVLATI